MLAQAPPGLRCYVCVVCGDATHPATRLEFRYRLPVLRGRHQPNTETSTRRCQSAVKLAAGLDLGRTSPAGISTPSVKLGVACASAETQTDPLTVERGQPIVNFLNSADFPPIEDCIPNCYPLGDATDFVRSPWVPVIIEGVRVPMLLDTGAEVTYSPVIF